MTTLKRDRFVAVSLGIPILFSLALLATAYLSLPPIFIGTNERMTTGLLGSLVTIALIFIFGRLDTSGDRRGYLKMSRQTVPNLFLGAILGVLLATIMIGLQVTISGLQVQWSSINIRHFLWLSLSLLPLAWMEELAFRSVAFFKLSDRYGIWVAQLAIAVLFALYHFVGGWSLVSSFAGPFVWSFAFGLLALRTGSLASPTGFHFGLNVVLAFIGSKSWIPGVVSIDFSQGPTASQVATNEWVGYLLQGAIFVVLLVLTHRSVKASTNH